MVFISYWHKLKVIWSLMTPRLSQIALAAPQHAEIQGWLCGGKLIPSINIMILIYSHMLTCWTRVEIFCDVFWFHGCVWSPPMPNVEFVKIRK